MKRTLFILGGILGSVMCSNAQTEIAPQTSLEAIFAEGPYDFADVPENGGGDLWYADGWNVPVIAADFNGDGNKDVFVSGNVCLGDVTSASARNVLYLGDGTGKFTKHELPDEGAYYFGGAHYIKISNDVSIIATTGSKKLQGEWYDPFHNTGLKFNLTTMLHQLSFDGEGNPVWTKIVELPDGAAGAGLGLHLYDFNKDNHVDVLISGWIGLPDKESDIEVNGPDAQILYLADGNGGFIRKSHNETGLTPMGNGNSVVADLNGDGFPDVVAICGKSGKSWNDATKKGEGTGVTVSLNNGNGTFTTRTLIPSATGNGWFFSAEGARVQVADFNNDGKPDIWVGNNDQVSSDPWRYRASFFLNDGTGQFTEHNKNSAGQTVTPLGVERATPIVADLNQDGNIDLWYNTWLPTSDLDDAGKGNNLQQLVGVLQLGDGKGGFDQKIFLGENDLDGNKKMSGYYNRMSALKSPVYAVADFNNDGVADFVATSGDAHTADYKGLTYVMGTASATPNGLKLPADNTLAGGPSSIGSIKDNSVYAYYNNGSLSVSGAAGQTVSVYTILGNMVYNFTSESDYYSVPLKAETGVYIVRVGKCTQKIAVNNQ